MGEDMTTTPSVAQMTRHEREALAKLIRQRERLAKTAAAERSKALLADFGVDVGHDRAGWAASLGLKLTEGPLSGVLVKSVLSGSAAAQAGIAAGDELLAVDGWRIRRLDDAQAWAGREQPFELLLVRDQRVCSLRVRPQPDSTLARSVTLSLATKPGRAVLARRRGWLQV